MSKKRTKGRSFAISRHHGFDSHKDNLKYAGISEIDWSDMINQRLDEIANSDDVEYLAYIYHDRDISRDGGIKPLHCHIIVRFKKSMEQEDVASLFDTSERLQNCETVRNHLGVAQYMIHISKEALSDEKFIYEPDDVVEYNCTFRDMIKESYWKKPKNNTSTLKVMTKPEAEDYSDDLGRLISLGQISKSKATALLDEHAGYSWVRRLSHTFEDDERRFKDAKVKDLIQNGRDLKNIHIMGDGGIGKSFIASVLGNKLADGRGVHMASSVGINKTPDVTNGYSVQKVMILNELSPSAFGLDEFNNVYDRYIYSSFPSRNENKDFIGEYCIFTNSISPLRFAKDLIIYDKGGKKYQDSGNKTELDPYNSDGINKYWQVRRRFSSYIVLSRDDKDTNIVNADVFNLRVGFKTEDGLIDNSDGTHILVGRVSFEAIPETQPKVTGEVLEKLIFLLNIDMRRIFNDDEVNIDMFLKDNGMSEVEDNELIYEYIEDVVDKLVWDVVPSEFLYDIYKVFRERKYPNSEIMNLNEFTPLLARHLEDWERKENSIKVGFRMDKDEPLISEFDLDKPKYGILSKWASKDYCGEDIEKKRGFVRQKSYRGFVRL